MAKPPNPTGSQIMIEKYIKQGITSGRAIAMALDHFNDQHWSDRDRYGELIKELTKRVAELEARD